ncbi:MAG: hypothetical protein CMJ28_04280 [Phycisphaerae bacterium]|nr:hypothetical protein [Phycisphaerae bacterium]
MLSTLVASLAVSTAAPSTGMNASTIPEVAIGSKRLDTLVAAVKAAGLVEALAGDGPFTVFAPTDAAFTRLGEETLLSLLQPEAKQVLTRILTHHVVAGRYDAKRILSGETSLKTLAGTTLEIELVRGRVFVGEDVVVETADVSASNGVVHLIDRVLMPPPAPVSPCQAFLERALRRGVPLYNEGDHVGCTAVYATALDAVLSTESWGIPEMARKRLLGEFNRVEGMRDVRDQAWAYREIIDTLLASEDMMMSSVG